MKVSPLALGELAKIKAETAGFPADLQSNRLWRDPNCRIVGFELTLGLLSTDCAARAGASGSPILTRGQSGALEIVGMIVQETNPRSEVIRQFDRNHQNLAIFALGIWPNIQRWIGEDFP